MKFIGCKNCGQFVVLAVEERTCPCGQCGGHYFPDRLHAEYWGDAFPMAIGNASIVTALREAARQEAERQEAKQGQRFDAWVIPWNSDTMKHVRKKA